MRRYKVALIGLGRIAWRGFPDNPAAETHLQTIRQHPGLELAAAIDIDSAVCAEFTAATGIATWAGDGLPPVDIAVICTPPESHADYIDGIVEAPTLRGILCEKPLASSVEDAERIVARCAEKGVTLLVGHQRRYCSAHTALKDFVASGVLGEPVLAHCRFTGSYLNNGTHAVDTLRYVAPDRRPEIEPSDTHPFRIRVACSRGCVELESYKMLTSGYQKAMYDDLIFSMVNGLAPKCAGADGVEAVRLALEAEREASA